MQGEMQTRRPFTTYRRRPGKRGRGIILLLLISLLVAAPLTALDLQTEWERAVGQAQNKEYTAALETVLGLFAAGYTDIPEFYLITSVSYVATGYYDKALKDLEKAIALDPGFVDGWYQLGIVYLNLERFAEAVTHLEQAQTIDPAFPNLQFFLARAYTRLGQTSQAIDAYGRALEQLPADFDARWERGILLWDAGRLDEAFRDFDEAIGQVEQDPTLISSTDAAALYTNRGSVYLARNQAQKAYDDMMTAIGYDPANHRAWFNLSAIHRTAGRLEDTAQALAMAITSYSEGAAPVKYVQAMAEVQRKLGDAELAAAYYRKVHEFFVGQGIKDPDITRALGELAVERGLYQTAVEWYTETIRRYPEDVTNEVMLSDLLQRGVAYAALQELDTALADFAAALEYGQDAQVHAERGKLRYRLEQYDLALEDFSRAIELRDPRLTAQLAGDYRQRGILYYEAGLYAQSLADLDQIVRLLPDEAQSHLERGQVRQAAGLHEAAAEDFAAAIERYTGSEPYKARYYRAYSLAILGRFDESIAEMDRLLEGGTGEYGHYQLRAAIYETLGDGQKAAEDYRRMVQVIREQYLAPGVAGVSQQEREQLEKLAEQGEAAANRLAP